MSIPIVIKRTNYKKQIPNPNSNTWLPKLGFGIYPDSYRDGIYLFIFLQGIFLLPLFPCSKVCPHLHGPGGEHVFHLLCCQLLMWSKQLYNASCALRFFADCVCVSDLA